MMNITRLRIRANQYLDVFVSTDSEWTITEKEIVVRQTLFIDGKLRRKTWHYPMTNIVMYQIEEEIDDKVWNA